MEQKVGMATIGHIAGVAEVRDKNGNLKGTFTFGGLATVEEASAVSGKSAEQIMDNLGKNLVGDSNGSDSDHGRS